MKTSLFGSHRKNDRATLRKQERRRPFQVESLEGRQLLSTFTVTNGGDSGGPGTLRYEIAQSNATPSTSSAPNVIQFDFNAIDGGQGNQQVTINLGESLPTVTQPLKLLGGLPDGTPGVVINGNFSNNAPSLTLGSTAPGSEVEGLVITSSSQGNLVVEGANDLIIDNYLGTNAAGTAQGSNYGSSFGVLISSPATGTVVEDNVISGNGIGIAIDGATDSNITTNNIGTDRTGLVPVGNGVGVEITGGAQNNIVGFDNVISGNTLFGVVIAGHGTSGNVVEGSFLGTDRTGTIAISSSPTGVDIAGGASNNTVGGTNVGEGNVISAHSSVGVQISDAGTSFNVVEGNFIGTNLGGTSPLANGTGVSIINGASSNTIGGTPNVISGNSGDGVSISGSSQNVVEGNRIGTNASGSAAIGNGRYGVELVSGSSGNTIGGLGSLASNQISGNGNNGVTIDNSSNNVVASDLIGTNAGGNYAVSNGGTGVWISGGSTNNTIGGVDNSNTRNVISGNDQLGVVITGTGTSGNVVEGDVIGTDASGTFAIPNRINGVDLVSGANGNTIGGPSAFARNIISGNTYNGVVLAWSGTNQNTIEGNWIGLNSGGNALGNGADGVVIQGASADNVIGGTVAGAGNVISGNAQQGVLITDPGTTGNRVAGNAIGTDSQGNASVDALGHSLGNGYNGVDIGNGASSNTVGGTTSLSRNVVSNNTYNGVVLTDQGTSFNVVEGNAIGTNLSETGALPNGADGVVIQVGASSNTIGGTATGSGDVLSGNRGWGVFITDAGTAYNVVQGEKIGTNADGTAAIPNAYNGLDILRGASNNTVGGSVAGAGNLISGNAYNGLVIAYTGASNNAVEGNLIGTNASGTSALPNGANGLVILGGATNNTVGGTTSAADNVISGNAGDGVLISDSGTSGNLLQGNFIGNNALDTAALPNGGDGVVIQGGASNNTIGGTTLPETNVISGNAGDGVLITDSGTSGNLVEGNNIGADLPGVVAFQNDANGVAIVAGATGNQIDSNEIAGNLGNGVYLSGAGTSYNTIANDFIGNDGLNALPNLLDGVVIQAGASANVVSYSTISGNHLDGVLVTGTGTNNNVLEHNEIGVNFELTGIILAPGHSVSNTDGVQISGGVSGTLVISNEISGNSIGVEIDGSATSNEILDNQIGTITFAGSTTLSNSLYGVYLVSTSGNTIDNNAIDNSGSAGIEFLASPANQVGGNNTFINDPYSMYYNN